jgi:hypothetical protein
VSLPQHSDLEKGNKVPHLSSGLEVAFLAPRKLSKDTAVWEREDRYWRMRKPGDATLQKAEAISFCR